MGLKIRFEACHRCGGDCRIIEDFYGKILNCLQCGWYREIEDHHGNLVDNMLNGIDMGQALNGKIL